MDSSVCTFASLFFFFQETNSVLIDIAINSLLLCDSRPKSLLQYYSGYVRSASRGSPRCSGHWSLARPCKEVVYCTCVSRV